MICDLVSEKCLGGCRGKVLSCFPLKEWSYTNDRQGQIPGVDCHLYCVEKTFSLACRSFAWPFFFPGLNLWPDLGKGRIFSLILDCFTNTGNILNHCRLLPLVCFPFRGFYSKSPILQSDAEACFVQWGVFYSLWMGHWRILH